MSTDIVKQSPSELEDKRDLIMSLYCKGLNSQEAEHFFVICKKMELNPLAKQIYVYKMGGKMTIIVSIDGLRLTADRTKEYSPGKETVYSYKKDGSVLSATAYVKKLTKDGTWHEISAIAFFDEYSTGTNLWKKMPHVMIAKCAEAQALRKAFPAELSGVYTKEEMEQAGVDEEITVEDISEELPDITLEKASQIISEHIGLEDNDLLKEYITYCMSKTKNSLRVTTNKWIEKKEMFIQYFSSWREKQAQEPR